MSRQAMPPTPAASTELAAKEDAPIAHLHQTFELPPAACPPQLGGHTSPPTSTSSKRASAQSSPIKPFHTPQSPARKRTASQASLGSDHLSLPPPPSRSRKIIQVEPKERKPRTSGKQTRDAGTVAMDNEPAITASGRKKQAKASSAGKKVARKTAHSLIERRRRSKMNEEFGVLKGMIPACAGQDMHKLAILQAGIDYMRYLEQCLADIKSGKLCTSPATSSAYPTRPQSAASAHSSPQTSSQIDEPNDAPILDTARSALLRQRLDSAPSTAMISPAMSAVTASPAFSANTYNSSSHRDSASHFELPASASAQIIGGRSYAPYSTAASVTSSRGHSNQTSPNLLPQSSHSSAPSELDQEASAALLMLNASDRRTGSSSGAPIESQKTQARSRFRGISVKDLLSH